MLKFEYESLVNNAGNAGLIFFDYVTIRNYYIPYLNLREGKKVSINQSNLEYEGHYYTASYVAFFEIIDGKKRETIPLTTYYTILQNSYIRIGLTTKLTMIGCDCINCCFILQKRSACEKNCLFLLSAKKMFSCLKAHFMIQRLC